ncbi:hypothetical protein [Geodermatophilus ruber]|nr:hypothetical protein [Geodermatophilus ruber]
MAVLTPLREAPPAADGAGGEPPDDRGMVVCFRVEDDGGLSLIWTAPLPAGADPVAAGAASPLRPS